MDIAKLYLLIGFACGFVTGVGAFGFITLMRKNEKLN